MKRCRDVPPGAAGPASPAGSRRRLRPDAALPQRIGTADALLELLRLQDLALRGLSHDRRLRDVLSLPCVVHVRPRCSPCPATQCAVSMGRAVNTVHAVRRLAVTAPVPAGQRPRACGGEGTRDHCLA